jgi:hypothetical protein
MEARDGTGHVHDAAKPSRQIEQCLAGGERHRALNYHRLIRMGTSGARGERTVDLGNERRLRELGAERVILDERNARRLAQDLGLPIIGVLGILLASS